MIRLPILSAFVLVTIAACTTATPAPEAASQTIVADQRPLRSLPADAGLRDVRNDLLATAGDRFGQERLAEALAAPTHLIAKRFAGMLPPPPPGEATPEYVPPAALMMKTAQGWMVATASGWRPATPEHSAEIDRLIADPAFWAEPATDMPCPDYGASLLLLKVPGKANIVRKSGCPNLADKAVAAAING